MYWESFGIQDLYISLFYVYLQMCGKTPTGMSLISIDLCILFLSPLICYLSCFCVAENEKWTWVRNCAPVVRVKGKRLSTISLWNYTLAVLATGLLSHFYFTKYTVQVMVYLINNYKLDIASSCVCIPFCNALICIKCEGGLLFKSPLWKIVS